MRTLNAKNNLLRILKKIENNLTSIFTIKTQKTKGTMTTESKRLSLNELVALVEAQKKSTDPNVTKTAEKPRKKADSSNASESKRLTMDDLIARVEAGKNLDGTRATKTGTTTSKTRSLKTLLNEEPVKSDQNYSKADNNTTKLVEAVENSYQMAKSVDAENNEFAKESQTTKLEEKTKASIEEKGENIDKPTSTTKKTAKKIQRDEQIRM